MDPAGSPPAREDLERAVKAMDYFAFVDESGQKEYFHPYDRSHIDNPDESDREFWLKNYLAVVALLIPRENLPDITREIVRLKEECFQTSMVEIKSSGLRIPQEREERYLIPFDISEEDLNTFGENILSLFSKFEREITIVACVFDKRYYKNREDNNPYLNSMQVVFERVEYTMQERGALATLVIDQVESSIHADRGRSGKLREVFLGKRPAGLRFVERYTHIKDIEFRCSKDDHLLQLADIAAYNVFRQFVDYGREWEKSTANVTDLPLYKYFRAIWGNLRKKDGDPRGWGICKLPSAKK
jgi:hypothetical protein